MTISLDSIEIPEDEIKGLYIDEQAETEEEDESIEEEGTEKPGEDGESGDGKPKEEEDPEEGGKPKEGDDPDEGNKPKEGEEVDDPVEPIVPVWDDDFNFVNNGQSVAKKLTREEVTAELSKAHDYTQKTQALAEDRRLIEQLRGATGYSLKQIVDFYVSGKKPGEKPTEESSETDLKARVVQLEAEREKSDALRSMETEIFALVGQDTYKDIDPVELVERAAKAQTKNFKLVADGMLADKIKDTKTETSKEMEARIRKELQVETAKKEKEEKRKAAALLDGGSTAAVETEKPVKYGKEGVEEFISNNKDFKLTE